MSDRPFGKYELGDRIASGGMAEVFRGRVRGPEGFVKEVCIKRILPHFSDDTEFVEMFVSEARVAAQLHHANIVQIFDFDSVDGQYYIAMELVDGVDLRRIIQRSRASGARLPVEIAVFVATEMLKGLHYAHTRRWEGRPLGLIHRDVSPHNVLVSHAGEVKLADFGIAKAASRASATRTGVVKGKLPYMAPEQARAGAVDARVDVYATGVVLYEMLAGARPFVADSDAELMAAILRAPIVPLSERREDVSPAIVAIVDRLLARDPDERYSAAGEAMRALAVHAPPDGSIRLADHLAVLLGTGPGLAPREATVRIGPGAAPSAADTPVVPAESDAATRTRRPVEGGGDAEVLAYAPTALGRSDSVPTSDSGIGSTDLSTRIVTTTGATPAPISRTGAIAAATLTSPRPRPPSRAFKPLLGAVAIVVVIGLGLVVSIGGDDPPVVVTSAAPATIGFSLPRAAPVSTTTEPQTPAAASVAAAPSTSAAQAAASTSPPEERGFGSIFCSAEPWATIEFRGREVGTTPREIENVPAGTHRVVLIGPHGERRAKAVHVRRGRKAVFRTRFEISKQ